MPRQPMMPAAGDDGTSFASHSLEDSRALEAYQGAPDVVSLADAQAGAGHQIGGDIVQQQATTSQLAPPPPTKQQNHVSTAEEAEGKEKRLKVMRESLLLVASLLASVTYQAGLSPPGGFWQDTSPEGTKKPHRAGDPVLHDTNAVRFKVFNYFNSLAFAYAVATMMQLMMGSVVEGWSGRWRKLRFLLGLGSVRRMNLLMLFSLFCLGVAFAVGSHRNWRDILALSAAPLYAFLSGVAFDLYSPFRKWQQKRLVSSANA